MADLDDFFAKKDRKKSKSTKKFSTTTEELVKKIEDTSARIKNDVRPAARAPVGATLTGTGAASEGSEESGEATVPVAVPVVEDEWREFEVEERKDYSGLKIGQLQIVDDEAGNADDGSYDKYDSDGELNTDQDRQPGGPWKKVEEGANKGAVPAVAQVAVAPSGNSAYVSPGMRNYTPLKARTRKGILPDIHDQDYFPVLGSAKPEEVKKKKPEPGYEEVRHGGRLQRSSDIATNAPVSIGNRFNSLADS